MPCFPGDFLSSQTQFLILRLAGAPVIISKCKSGGQDFNCYLPTAQALWPYSAFRQSGHIQKLVSFEMMTAMIGALIPCCSVAEEAGDEHQPSA